MPTALTTATVKNWETAPVRGYTVFQGAASARERAADPTAPWREGGASQVRLRGPNFPLVLGDKSMLYSSLVIRLHHSFVAGEKLSFAGKFLGFAPVLP